MKGGWQILLNFSFALVILLFLIELPAQAAIETFSNSRASAFFDRGIENTNNHNYQQALSDFTRVINLKTDFVSAAYSNRCLVQLQLGNNQAAKSDCTAALQLNPDNAEAYLNRGLAEYRLGNYPAAIKQYQEVIQRIEDDYRAYYNQGLAHFAQQDYEKALDDYERALLLNNVNSASGKASIYNDKGLVYLMLSDLRAAIADLSEAIRLDSSNERAYYNRACAYHRNHNYTGAIADFTQVLKLNPHYAQAYVNRGLLRHEIGLEQAAIEDFKTALNYFNERGKIGAYQQTLALMKQLQQILAQSNRSDFS
jgi:tetratricopeptide (TPR) repeat protein